MLLGAGETLDDHGAQLLRLAPQRPRGECRQPPRVEGELARALPREDVGDVGLRARVRARAGAMVRARARA